MPDGVFGQHIGFGLYRMVVLVWIRDKKVFERSVLRSRAWRLPDSDEGDSSPLQGSE
jgi:hypothetical protein